MSDALSRSPVRRGTMRKLDLVDGVPSDVITAELGVSSMRAAVAPGQIFGEWRKRCIGAEGAA